MGISNVYDILKERGFIAQATHEEKIREILGKEKVTFILALIQLLTACMWAFSAVDCYVTYAEGRSQANSGFGWRHCNGR